MKARLRGWSFPALMLPVLLSACGGGGSSGSGPCTAPCVESGYFGDMDWQIADSAADGGGGVGGGGDGSGGVGAGGADGQFRKALVVARFPSGEELGSALTDDARGMVTIRPGSYQGPLLVEIHGQPGASYFEEGKNVYVPYESGRIQRTIVPYISTNIGLTPFSEAAYQLSLRCQAGDGPVSACGAGASQSREKAIPSKEAIKAANGHVRDVLNQLLPSALQVDNISRLPFIVNDGTTANQIGTTPRGRYGLVNIGFSKQAAMYNTASPTPTLLAIDQLSKDLLDGRLDGLSDGATVGAAPLRTYDAHTLVSELSAALAQQTTRYGLPEAIAVLPAITAFGNTRYDSYYFDATLEPNGATSTIAVATEAPGGTRTPGQKRTYVDSSRRGFMLFGNMGSGSLFIKTDSLDSTSSILAVGDNTNGELGDGTDKATGPAGPSVINLPAVLTHAAGGIGHTVARLADGSVYAWGDNTYGQLGQGVGAAALPRSSQPVRVNLPAGALAVAASNQASFALLEDTSVYSWGSAWGFGTLGDNSANGERSSPGRVLSTNGTLSGVVQISARDNDVVALTADGTVWTWGSFSAQAPVFSGITGIVPGNMVATPLQGVPVTTGGIRKVLTEQGIFAAVVAGNDASGADLDGAVYAWGIHFDITAGGVLPDQQPRRVLNLPRIRDLMQGGFQGYGQRPADRLTAMAIAYDGGLWKIRGRVAEQYDPANPIAQRRPQGQVNRPDCDTCHVVRPKTLPAIPTTGPTCVIPAHIAVLLTTQSKCENCHNDAPGARPPLTCVPGPLNPPGPPTTAPEQTAQCVLNAGHPPVKANASCASCHNSVIAPPLQCAPNVTPLEPASPNLANITGATDDAIPVTGQIADNGITNDTTPTLAGGLTLALAAGESVTVLANGELLGTASAAVGATAWTFTPVLAPGGYDFRARVDRSGAGSGTPGNAFRLTIATEVPRNVVSIDEVDSPTADNTPTLNGSFSVPLTAGETLRLQRSNPGGTMSPITVPSSGSSWTFTEPAPLADGTYTYRGEVVAASGVAGGLAGARTVVIDTTAPNAQPEIQVSVSAPPSLLGLVTGPKADGEPIADASPQITVSGVSPGDVVQLMFAIGDGPPVPVPNGRQTANSSGSIGPVDHTIVQAVPMIEGDGAPTLPNGQSLTVSYSTQLIDAVGNIANPAASSTHLVQLFNCETLRLLSATHLAGGANASNNCTSCHYRPASAPGLQRVPASAGNLQPPFSAASGYWCTVSPAGVGSDLESPFLKKR